MSVKYVVGLDLSITATGICGRYADTWTVGGKADLGDRRLSLIVDSIVNAIGIDGWVAKHTLVVVEGLAIHGPGGAMAAAQLMGAVKVALMGTGTSYVEVPPSTLKKFATGKGNAGKPEMAVALYKRAGLELANDNEVDAWWLRAAGMQTLGHPVVHLPDAQVAALDKVQTSVNELTKENTAA